MEVVFNNRMNKMYKIDRICIMHIIQEKSMHIIAIICAGISIISLAVISLFLFIYGVPFISKIGLANFLSDKWNINTGQYGILSMIVTSLYVTSLSGIIGITIGLLSAIALYKFCPRKLVSPICSLVNLLAAVPSVIFGLFGMIVIVPFLRDNISPNGVGYGILASSIILAIMIMPTIVSLSLTSLKALPISYYEGALALGASQEESVFRVMLPSAKYGIANAVVLSLGRAIGETMAVIMVIGNSPEMPRGMFQSVRTLTSNIAIGALELTGDPHMALISSGVVLFFFILLLNISFSYINKGYNR